MKCKYFSLSLLLLSGLPAASYACDVCSIYQSVESQKAEANTFRLSLAEQFAGFDKVQLQGAYVENVEHQHLESSITQLVGTYDLNDKFGFQINLPYIHRRFRRFENGADESGSEAGIGDATALLRFFPYRFKDGQSTFSLQLFGGLKLPTGDSDRLGEDHGGGMEDGASDDMPADAADDDHAGHHHEEAFAFRHGDESHGTPSAIHGHDLALGSGSYDFPVGLSIFGQVDRFLLTGSCEYSFRTKGDHDYEFDDQFIYNVGPGYYVALGHEYTVALLASLSGEYKGKDKGPEGEEVDTGVRSVYFGPQVFVTLNDRFSGELGWDIPVDINNTGFQAVPSYRLRAGITYRF